ncbi:MAG: helix-turn-helix domain-containing protein [Clostridia bacterium]|nr:helix-turn-helix domain-containing protein [Clostridia bacterium]
MKKRKTNLYAQDKNVDIPFALTNYGVTPKNSTYHIIRENSSISCLEYVISGSGVIICNNRTFFANAGDSYMLLSGNHHDYYSYPHDPLTKIWINFSGNLGINLASTYHLDNTVLFKNTNIFEYISKIHHIYDTVEDETEKQNQSALVFHQAIQYLYKCQNKFKINTYEIELAKYYIDCHIHENITIDFLANLTNYSKGHFIRTFKSVFGVSPHQYILDSKISSAKLMLNNTDKSIADISNQLNFSNPNNFSAQFEQKVGVRPSVYRKSKQMNN